MAELIGGTLLLLLIAVWILVSSIKRLLNRKNELRPERLSVKHLGLTADQHLRLCALARAKNISQKSMWAAAALEYLEKHTTERGRS